VISSIESKSDQSKQGIAMSYRMKIEEELKDICNQVLQLLDDHLIAKASTPESKVNTRAHTLTLLSCLAACLPIRLVSSASPPRQADTTVVTHRCTNRAIPLSVYYGLAWSARIA
jgi:hypothetical protein